MSTPECILTRQAAQFFVYAEMIPLAISGAISVINTVANGGPFFYYLSIWLFASHYTLYPFQAYFNRIRVGVMCALGEKTYEFPDTIMYYVASIVTVVIMYAVLWPTKPWKMKWIYTGGLFLIAAFVLCWFGFNTWYEVLFSALWAGVMTIGFMMVMRYFLRPAWPYLECLPPCTWIGISDKRGWLCPHTPEYLAYRKRLRKLAGLPDKLDDYDDLVHTEG